MWVMADAYICLQGGVKKGQKNAYVIFEWSPSIMTSAYVAHQDIAIFVTRKFTRGRLQTTFANFANY